MKITFVTHNYLPFTGGIEKHVAQMAQTLSMRHEVTVAAMNFRNFSLPRRLAPLASNLLAENNGKDHADGSVRVLSLAPKWTDRLKMIPLLLRSFPVLPRWFYHHINRITHPFFLWAIRHRLAEIIRTTDIVHIMGALDLGWATLAVANHFKTPVVCTPFVHPLRWGDGPNDVTYYKKCSAVIGLVASDRDYLAEIGVPPSQLHTIGVSPSLPTSIDEAAFRCKSGWDDEPIVLYVGRMVAEKGAEAIIGAAAIVWQFHPNARFAFVGPGTDKDLLIFRNCDSRIKYLGRATEEVKAEALAACTIFCMPSISEILPTVYLEAWSLGKPVIGGTAHGLRELVEGNNAGITVPQTPEATAEAIVRLLSDATLARLLGDNGRQLVLKRYSTEAVSKTHEGLYESIVHHVRSED